MLIELIFLTVLVLILISIAIKSMGRKKSIGLLTILIVLLFGGSVAYLWAWYLYLS